MTNRNKISSSGFQDIQDHEHEQYNLGLAEQLCFITSLIYTIPDSAKKKYLESVLYRPRQWLGLLYRIDCTLPFKMPHQVPPAITTGDSTTHLHTPDIPLLLTRSTKDQKLQNCTPAPSFAVERLEVPLQFRMQH